MRHPQGAPLKYVRWDETLAAGTQLFFSFYDPSRADAGEVDAGPGVIRRTVGLQVTREAELPSVVGGIASASAFGSFHVASIDGDCSHDLIASYVDLELVFNQAAAALGDALYVETRVDERAWGRVHPNANWFTVAQGWLGGSSLGHKRERVYLPCALPRHGPDQFEPLAKLLEPGHHTARMVAWLPDGTELSSEPYEFELTCPAGSSDPANIRDAGAPVGRPPATAGGNASSPAADGGGCSVLGPGLQRRPAVALALLWLCQLAWRAATRSRRSVAR